MSEERRNPTRKRANSIKECDANGNSKRRPKGEEKKEGIFWGICALFVERGVNGTRLQIWKKRFESLGGTIADPNKKRVSRDLNYVLAVDRKALDGLPDAENLAKLFLPYDWLQTCLTEGILVSTESYQSSVVLREPETTIVATAALEQQDLARTCQLQTPDVTNPGEEHKTISEITSTSRESSSFLDRTQDGTSFLVRTEENATITAGTSVAADDQEEPVEEEDASSDEDENMNFKEKLRRKQTFYGKQENPNLNEHLTNPLAEMWHLYEDVLGDQWRSLIYRKTVNKLRSLPYKVTSVEQIREMYGVGKSLVKMVKEILGTGQLQKLDNLKAQVGEIQVLGSVWGIGAIQARELYKKGFRTVKDLENYSSLTSMQRMGVKYYDDINLRIPRDEVVDTEKFVRGVVETLAPGAWVNAAGSYRRGKPTCGDVDILITHPDGSSHQDLLARLVQELRRIEFIVDGLRVDANARKGGTQPDMFMGIFHFQCKAYRRIDIKVYPRHVYAFALLAFTGNDVLNRKIRFLARVKFGYKLSDQGLFIRESKKKDSKASTESIPCETEREIFEKLGLDYPEPHDRNW
ncbi:DNA polymerase lambda [Selaginella moellendorffii]|nr:DNA polymerase lambda [Selaginella moellendorffii]|eukprot:XP_002982398.2 DNA polymerase lambda [Selaginella moellendorffii]